MKNKEACSDMLSSLGAGPSHAEGGSGKLAYMNSLWVWPPYRLPMQ